MALLYCWNCTDNVITKNEREGGGEYLCSKCDSILSYPYKYLNSKGALVRA